MDVLVDREEVRECDVVVGALELGHIDVGSFVSYVAQEVLHLREESDVALFESDADKALPSRCGGRRRRHEEVVVEDQRGIGESAKSPPSPEVILLLSNQEVSIRIDRRHRRQLALGDGCCRIGFRVVAQAPADRYVVLARVAGEQGSETAGSHFVEATTSEGARQGA